MHTSCEQQPLIDFMLQLPSTGAGMSDSPTPNPIMPTSAFAQQNIQDLLRQLSFLDGDRARSWVEEEIQKANAYILALRYHQNSEIALINRILPTEMLVAIFIEAITPPVVHTSPHYEEAIIPISQVCSLWRTIALGTGSCWKVLNLHKPRIASVFAARSNNANLRLNLYDGLRRIRLSPKQIDHFRRYAPQLVSITLCRPHSRIALFDGVPLPRLQHLKLANWEGPHLNLDSSSVIRELSRSPLRSLNLQHVQVNWRSPMYSGLTSLSLTSYESYYSMTQLLDILARCPHLQNLSIRGTGFVPTFPSHERQSCVSLKDLEHLELCWFGGRSTARITAILPHISIPASTQITLEDYHSRHPAVWPEYYEAVTAALTPLQVVDMIHITIQRIGRLEMRGFSDVHPHPCTCARGKRPGSIPCPSRSHVSIPIISNNAAGGNEDVYFPHPQALNELTRIFRSSKVHSFTLRDIPCNWDLRRRINLAAQSQAWTTIFRAMPQLETLFLLGHNSAKSVLHMLVRDIGNSLKIPNTTSPILPALSTLMLQNFALYAHYSDTIADRHGKYDLMDAFRVLVQGLEAQGIPLREVRLMGCVWPKGECKAVKQTVMSALKEILYPICLTIE
ncbi:hypothetical protein K474DRAFT_325696 [Panus rudis PR-1116 ss-1]|nr:hypothetical protein K474DRAFT_325696 [Panus rudis PR-1116 ss-1]